jgi:hypothetical protein
MFSQYGDSEGHAIAQTVGRQFLRLRRVFDPRSGHVGFVVDKMALWNVFFEYFTFPANSHFTDCSIFINHPITNAIKCQY